MFQLSLQFLNSRETLADLFKKFTGKTISLNLTDNSTSMLSVRKKSNSVSVRMHWMFLNGSEDVIREIADFIKAGKGRTPLLRQFINENQACLKKRGKSAKKDIPRKQGRFHDLGKIFSELNQEYFGGRVTATIGWGKQNVKKLVKKRTLGSYNRQTDTVWISPMLDRRNIPRYFVKFVVYHEMLHSVVREEKKNGRTIIHTSEFRKRERLFEGYGKAVLWESKR